jgi:hypothetical protein
VINLVSDVDASLPKQQTWALRRRATRTRSLKFPQSGPRANKQSAMATQRAQDLKRSAVMLAEERADRYCLALPTWARWTAFTGLLMASLLVRARATMQRSCSVVDTDWLQRAAICRRRRTSDAPPCTHEAAREHGDSKHVRRTTKRRVCGAGAIISRVAAAVFKPLGGRPQAVFSDQASATMTRVYEDSPHGRGSAKATREAREGRQRHPCLHGGGRDRQRDNLPPHGCSAALFPKYSFRCSLP